jgi:hypothetical protein
VTGKGSGDEWHPVLRPKRGGTKKTDLAIRKALMRAVQRLIFDLEREIGRLTTIHDRARADLVQLEAIRDASAKALALASEAHGHLLVSTAIWWTMIPGALEKGEEALNACRAVPGDAPPADVPVD